METQSTHTLNSSMVTAGVLALLAYRFANSIPGQPNAVISAAVAGVGGLVILMGSRPADARGGRRRTPGRALSRRPPARGASVRKATLADQLRSEEGVNADLYASIQRDLLTMAGHPEGSSDHEFFFHRARVGERSLARSNNQIRTLRRRLRAR